MHSYMEIIELIHNPGLPILLSAPPGSDMFLRLNCCPGLDEYYSSSPGQQLQITNAIHRVGARVRG